MIRYSLKTKQGRTL